MEDKKIETELKEDKKVVVEDGEIDQDVLETAAQECILNAITDDKQMKRVMLNCACEFLSGMKELVKQFDSFMELLTVVSADKLADFFQKLNENVKDETKRMELANKIKQSHKKSAKKSSKVISFPKNSVK